jgi:signal transduction histidine kinase
MSGPLKILHLEDNIYDSELIYHELKKSHLSFIPKVVSDKTAFISSISEFKPDLILSDHTLPQFNSVEALDIYKENNLDIPFILVTGTVSEEFAVSSIHRGADDYILKGNLTRLPSAIENALRKREAERQKKMALETLNAQNIDLSRINKELDHLVYSASHDLRSPLTSILGLLYILNVEKDPDKIKQYLNLIGKSVKKLDAIIKDIITYSRNTRREITVENINLDLMIRESFQELDHLHEGDEISLELKVDEDVPFFSDKDRLKIVLCNLFSNAVIFRKNTEPFIKANAAVRSQTVTIVVEDNGEGIPAKHIDKVFDMFYRGSEKSIGSGMGLYIVKEYLRKLNGSVRVESKEGKGTTFTVEIPNYYAKTND